MLRRVFLLGCVTFLIGCGATVEEVPPTEEAGPVMPEDQQKKAMEESMKRGMPKGAKLPTPGQ